MSHFTIVCVNPCIEDEVCMADKYRRWSPSDVLNELRKLDRLAPGFVRDHHSGLYGAAIRHFGSWKAAVSEAGIEYRLTISRNTHGHWTKERVISEIQQLKDRHPSVVRRQNVSLYSASLRLFSSWKDALIASGIDYEAVMKSYRAAKLRKPDEKPPGK